MRGCIGLLCVARSANSIPNERNRKYEEGEPCKYSLQLIVADGFDRGRLEARIFRKRRVENGKPNGQKKSRSYT